MTCPECRRGVPDNYVVCPFCAEARSAKAMRQYQHHPLRIISTCRGVFTTRAIHNVRHVQMFGCDKTYCGEPVESHHRRNVLLFEALRDLNQHICAKCIEQIDGILAEVTTCSA